MYDYRLVIVVAILAITFSVDASTHQRFSNLDRLLNRLDGSTELPPTSTVPTTSAPHKIRHAHWQQHNDNTFQQFDNIINNHNNDKYIKNNNNDKNGSIKHEDIMTFDDIDDNNDDDDDDDEDDFEEPQEERLQSDVRHRLPFTTSIGKMEWSSKSHRKSLDKLYNSFRHTVPVKMTGGEDDPRAYDEYRAHHVRMKKETECKIPQAKVIRVSDHYPSSTKTYQPSCTKLYRCDEDTGCCEGNRRCGAKSSQKIELYFYVLYDVPVLGRHHSRKAVRIEKLQFYNHTECECHDRSDEMPRDTDSPHKLQTVHENNYNRCKCPSEYTVRNLANGSCSCDCFDKQRDCTKYKKGKEYFNHQDRLCIEMRTCTVPACDFGVYIRRAGRCPRKHEKYRTWPRYKP